MKLEIKGEVFPPKGKEKYWSIGIPSLGVHTQGTSQNDAYEMAKDALETVFDGEIKFKIVASEGATFLAQLEINEKSFPLVLKRVREMHEMTVLEVSNKMGSKSPNAYGRYEQGKSVPSMEKFGEIMSAFNMEAILKIG